MAKFNISPFNPHTESVAAKADAVMQKAGAGARFDAPLTGLHTSLFYFCCHTPKEEWGIKAALHNMSWSSFAVHYDSFVRRL